MVVFTKILTWSLKYRGYNKSAVKSGHLRACWPEFVAPGHTVFAHITHPLHRYLVIYPQAAKPRILRQFVEPAARRIVSIPLSNNLLATDGSVNTHCLLYDKIT